MQHEDYVKRMKMEQAESYRQMLLQQKEMDKRFKEAGGQIGGEFGLRDKRTTFLSDAYKNI